MENTIQRDMVRKQNMRHEFKVETVQDYGRNAITKIIGF
jgi:hypothetical protein